MQTTSAVYFGFVASAFLAYWALARWRLPRLAVLLFANAFFCARFGLFYVVLIPAAALLDYLLGFGLMRFSNPTARRAILSLSLAMNLGLLIGSRHTGVILHDGWDWIFPLGLSFYTFQAMTYTIDLYRKDGEGTRSLLAYLAAACFFPTLLAGPICRLCDAIPQFEREPALTPLASGRALFLIGLGLVKKLLIADFLAQSLVNRVFDTPDLYTGLEALVAVLAYSLQLYYDFSGYTDITRGIAQLFAIQLPLNFDRPYLASDVAEFWRRWHMSFSSWLRDYLFYSLPGARSKEMPYVNLIVTMLLGGLWHGISWNFAVWGLLHGGALAIVRAWQTRGGRRREQIPWYKRLPATALTFTFVSFTWIFFRTATLAQAMQMLRRIFSFTVSSANLTPAFVWVLAIAAIGVLMPKSRHTKSSDLFSATPALVHAAVLAAIVIAIQSFGGQGSAPFVYSRF